MVFQRVKRNYSRLVVHRPAEVSPGGQWQTHLSFGQTVTVKEQSKRATTSHTTKNIDYSMVSLVFEFMWVNKMDARDTKLNY